MVELQLLLLLEIIIIISVESVLFQYYAIYSVQGESYFVPFNR